MSIWLEIFCGMGDEAPAPAPHGGFGPAEEVRDEPELEQWALKAPEPSPQAADAELEVDVHVSADEPDAEPETV